MVTWRVMTKAGLLMAILVGGCGLAIAEDIEGSKDHPLFGRYDGASIEFHKTKEFDEHAFLSAPHDYTTLLDRDATKDRSGAEWLSTEGRLTQVRYAIPADRSSLEVIRSYETALTSRGFTTVFKCADQSCFTGKMRDPYLLGQQIDPGNGISTAYFDHARYLLVQLDRPDGTVLGSIITGEDKGVVTAFLTVLETKPMQADKIAFIDSTEMQTAIDTAGSVSLYGILFDYDKDIVKPESNPTLDEIAKLMTAKTGLKLEIIGHTDGRGTDGYNLDLSQRRAANVAAALVRDFGILPDRLTSSGAGLSKPIAPNDTEDGRAKNRRVELVAR